MEVSGIKNILLYQIEEIGQDANTLSKVMEFIDTLKTKKGNLPLIEDDDLATYIKDDCSIIVPIVCDDMFEYIDDNGNSLSLGDFLCDRFKSDKTISAATIKTIRKDFYFGITLLEQDKRGKNLANSIYNGLQEAINGGIIKLKDSVKEFLSKGDFPVVVTTIGFPIIENALLQNYQSEWYNPNHRNDLPFVIDENSRIVYHIFGGETSNVWVYNEQTLLKFVHALHSDDYCAKNLSNYLRGNGNDAVKRPLVLGSKLPDWLFRFFVYPLYGDKFSESNGYWISLDEIERGLDVFLSRNKYTGQTNLRGGNRVDTVLADAVIEQNHLNQEEQKPYKIFVSYKREKVSSVDAEKIERIFEILRKKAKATGGNVWRDVEQVADGGNPYWANIKKAIKECNLFIPIVTFPYLEEFRDAPDVMKYAEDPIAEVSDGNANDDERIMVLNPVVREAYYAIVYEKKCAPIVIANQENTLNGGIPEAVIRDSNDNRNIPSYIFNERTNLVHDDNNPQIFNLPVIDE